MSIFAKRLRSRIVAQLPAVTPQRIPSGLVQAREFHVSRPPQSVAVFVGVGVAAAAVVGAARLWANIRAMRPDLNTNPLDPFSTSSTQQFYEGGFDDVMTKREAALILGCREGASKERIMQRYRTLMKVNHPDLGGSPLLSLKINEAKELLTKQAKSEPQERTRR